MATDSPQMANLKSRYGITTRRGLLRAIRNENNEMYVEPGEPKFTLRDAEVILDRYLEAEYQRIEGGAYDEGDPLGGICPICDFHDENAFAHARSCPTDRD